MGDLDEMKFSSRVEEVLRAWYSERQSSSATMGVGNSAAIGTDRGLRREENQDCVAAIRGNSRNKGHFAILVLADGMGGMQSGLNCAALTVSTFLANFLSTNKESVADSLLDAANASNEAVFAKYRGKGGATLSAIYIGSGGQNFGVNVGDSRIYGIGNNELVQLSVDDTLAGQLRDNARHDIAATQLLQYIGMGSDLQPHLVDVSSRFGRFVLTSDGAHSIGNAVLRVLAENCLSDLNFVRRVLATSRWFGGRDNASCAAFTIEDDQLIGPNEGDYTFYRPDSQFRMLMQDFSTPNSQASAREPNAGTTPLNRKKQKPRKNRVFGKDGGISSPLEKAGRKKSSLEPEDKRVGELPIRPQLDISFDESESEV